MSRGRGFAGRARFGRRCGMRSTRAHPAAPGRHSRRLGADRQRRDLGALTGASLIHPARRMVPVGAGRRRRHIRRAGSSPTTCSGATTSTDRGCRSPCRPTKRWSGSATTRPAPRPTSGRSGTARCCTPTGATAARSRSTSSGASTDRFRIGRSRAICRRSKKLNLFYAFTWIGLPGHLARRSHPPWPVVLLPRIRAVSRLLETLAARRSHRRRGPRGGRDRRTRRGVRPSLLEETSVATGVGVRINGLTPGNAKAAGGLTAHTV